MAVVVKIAVKTFNAEKLMEELASLPITTIGWAGFDRVGDGRRYQPAPSRRQIGFSSTTGADFADPGELRFGTSTELSAAQQTTLDATLAAHDNTLLTAEQTRQDQDEADLTTLQSLYDIRTLLSAVQITQARDLTMRHILRRERGAAI